MSKNFIFALVAVSDRNNYIARALHLIDSILKSMEVDFIILTDQPDRFKKYKTVKTITYTKPVFSFQDKKEVLKEALYIKDYVIMIDADHVVIENNTLNDLNNLNLEEGIYPQLLWKHPVSCSFENFLEGNTLRIPYGISYKQYCLSHDLNIDNITLIQESFFILKKPKEFDTFFKIWDLLANFCNEEDRKRDQLVLGYGEGYNLAVAARNSNIPVIENHPITISFTKNFKHLAWS
jgi:hypothetical protein